jgi:hypothetical protein
MNGYMYFFPAFYPAGFLFTAMLMRLGIAYVNTVYSSNALTTFCMGAVFLAHNALDCYNISHGAELCA